MALVVVDPPPHVCETVWLVLVLVGIWDVGTPPTTPGVQKGARQSKAQRQREAKHSVPYSFQMCLQHRHPLNECSNASTFSFECVVATLFLLWYCSWYLFRD
jgi:hypothetical protein